MPSGADSALASPGRKIGFGAAKTSDLRGVATTPLFGAKGVIRLAWMKREALSAEEELARNQLTKLRESLLGLHKALIDSERVGYEQTFGSIGTPNDFLRLLLNDPWFAWLRPLSGFITALDEALDGKEPITSQRATDMVKEARVMLTPNEEGEGFGKHYFIAMQRDPDVLLAHGAVAKLGR